MVRQALGYRANAEHPEQTDENPHCNPRIPLLGRAYGRGTDLQPRSEFSLREAAARARATHEISKALQVLTNGLGKLINGFASH